MLGLSDVFSHYHKNSLKKKSHVNQFWRLFLLLAVIGMLPIAILINYVKAAPNFQDTVVITKKFDGTGHGTDAACFVNSQENYPVGDDNDQDGVVCSEDIVGYEVKINFAAGDSRSVNFKLLDNQNFEVVSNSLCKNGTIFSTSGDDSNCTFNVKRGGVESIKSTVILKAKDSKGQVLDNRIKAQLGLNGSDQTVSSIADLVKIVSAPTADLHLVGSNTSYDQNAAGEGRFVISPKGLYRLNYSDVKGVSTEGDWFGYVDVADFPAGTTWTFNDNPVAVTDNKIDVTGNNGEDVELNFKLPAGSYPVEAGQPTMVYRARLYPTSGSFANGNGGQLNNGDDTQPGDNKTCQESTFDDQTGAENGQNLPNNDCGVVRFIYREIKSAIFSKSIIAPADSTAPIFAESNRLFSATDKTRLVSNYHYYDEDEQKALLVAPDTELETRLEIFSKQIKLAGDQPIAICDSWNNNNDAAQKWDTTRNLKVVDPNGVELDSSLYQVEYSNQADVLGRCGSLNDSNGWSNSPSDQTKAVRISLIAGAIPINDQAGAGKFTVILPFKSLDSYPAEQNGRTVPDRASGIYGTQNNFSQTTVLLEDFKVALPKDPKPFLEKTSLQPLANTGEKINYQLLAGVDNITSLSQTFTPTIVDTLDRCAVDPALDPESSAIWSMTVTPGVPGPSGQICNDPDSTPIKLTFKLNTNSAQILAKNYNAAQDRGLFEAKINYSVKAVSLTNTVDKPYNFANSAEMTLAESSLTAGSEATVSLLQSANSAAIISADFKKQEINQKLDWTFDLVSRSNSQTPSTSTVVILPFNGDNSLINQLDDPASYNGPTGSNFQGQVKLDQAEIVANESTDGVVTYYTTHPSANLTFDPNQSGVTWYLVSEAGQNGNPPLAEATGLKVDVPAADSTSGVKLKLSLTPTNNQADDIYLAWAGRSDVSYGSQIPMPWPDYIEVVNSSITGKVFWDDDKNARLDDTDGSVAGVEVKLYKTENGVETEVSTITTAADGSYSFTNLAHGQYKVKITDRGPNLPANITTHFNQTLPVEQTYSYSNQLFGNAQEESGLINIGIGQDLAKVDFGFFKPNPMAQLDKAQTKRQFIDGTNMVEFGWNVVVENTGNLPLKNTQLFDQISKDVIDFKAKLSFTRYTKFTNISTHNNRTVCAVDIEKQVYCWGSNWPASLGNGEPSGQRAAPVKSILPAGVKINQVFSGNGRTFVIADDGKTYVTGKSYYGYLGMGNTQEFLTFVEMNTIPNGVQFSNFAFTDYNSCALGSDGLTYCWGGGPNGENANGTNSWTKLPQPAQMPAGVTFTKMTGGQSHLLSHLNISRIIHQGDKVVPNPFNSP